MDDVLAQIKTFWDEDSKSYDHIPHHYPVNQAEWAAWVATVRRLLPTPPARVLDVGAGTGFLSIICARLGHTVTAADLSPGMLAGLRRKAAGENLSIEIVECPADDIPVTGFDVIVERHLLWTLPAPAETLAAWRKAAPVAKLVLFESMWGSAMRPSDAVRASGRRLLRRLKGASSNHHAEYSPDLRRHLPLGTGIPPVTLVEMVQSGGWRNPRLERLTDIEWATQIGLGRIESWLGVNPRFAVSAD